MEDELGTIEKKIRDVVPADVLVNLIQYVHQASPLNTGELISSSHPCMNLIF